MEDWDAWEATAETAHPVRYWIAEEFLDGFQSALNFIPDRLHDIKYYINNRWVDRTHALTAHPRDIKPGQWKDVGYRFLPCMFNELVNFVECELAWFNIAWDKEKRKQFKAPWWSYGWWRWRSWRNRDAGIDCLKWQMSLNNDWVAEDHPDFNKPSLQAINAKEIYELYIWWTQERPLRPDPSVASGWSAYCESRRDQGLRGIGKDPDVTGPMLDYMHELEEKYEQEDEDMMIRLIKVRRSLWT